MLSTEELLFIYCIYSFLFSLTTQSTSDYKSHLSIIHKSVYFKTTVFGLWDESIAPVQAQEETPHLHTGTFLI